MGLSSVTRGAADSSLCRALTFLASGQQGSLENCNPVVCLSTAPASSDSSKILLVRLSLLSCTALEPTGAVFAAALSVSAQGIDVLRYQPKSRGRIKTLYPDTSFRSPCGGCRMLSSISEWVLGSVLFCPSSTNTTEQDPASNSQALAMMDVALDKGSSHRPGDLTGTCWKTH